MSLVPLLLFFVQTIRDRVMPMCSHTRIYARCSLMLRLRGWLGTKDNNNLMAPIGLYLLLCLLLPSRCCRMRGLRGVSCAL